RRGLLWRIMGWDRNAHRYVAGCCSMAQFLHRRVLRSVPESAERCFIWKTNQRRTRAKRPVAFHDLLGLHHIKHFAALFGDRCARVRHVGHELFHVMDNDLSDQIRCHSFYVSSQEELVWCGWSPKDVVIVCAKIGDLTVDGSCSISRQAYGIRQEPHERSGG